MLWNVKNALNRDVEREHLNKILAEIRAAIGEKPLSQTITTVVQDYVRRQPAPPTPPPAPTVSVVLEGDVTGEGTADSNGQVVIVTSISDGDTVEEAPNTGEAYWRRAGDWEQIYPWIEQVDVVTTPPEDGDVLTYESDTETFVPRQPVVTDSAVPYFIPDGETYTVALYKQALWTVPITIGVGSLLQVDGILMEVD